MPIGTEARVANVYSLLKCPLAGERTIRCFLSHLSGHYLFITGQQYCCPAEVKCLLLWWGSRKLCFPFAILCSGSAVLSAAAHLGSLNWRMLSMNPFKQMFISLICQLFIHQSPKWWVSISWWVGTGVLFGQSGCRWSAGASSCWINLLRGCALWSCGE